MDLAWGVMREYAADIVLFYGLADGKRLILLGSSDSVVGEPKTVSANHAPFYYTLRFLDALARAGESAEPEAQAEPMFAQAIAMAETILPKARTPLEYLAKVLHVAPEYVVATPLYVALAAAV